jgi:hypothetical protein
MVVIAKPKGTQNHQCWFTRSQVVEICLACRFSLSPAVPADRGRYQQVLERHGVTPLPVESHGQAAQVRRMGGLNRPGT